MGIRDHKFCGPPDHYTFSGSNVGKVVQTTKFVFVDHLILFGRQKYVGSSLKNGGTSLCRSEHRMWWEWRESEHEWGYRPHHCNYTSRLRRCGLGTWGDHGEGAFSTVENDKLVPHAYVLSTDHADGPEIFPTSEDMRLTKPITTVANNSHAIAEMN